LILKHAILVVLGWKAMMAVSKKEKREQTPALQTQFLSALSNKEKVKTYLMLGKNEIRSREDASAFPEARAASAKSKEYVDRTGWC
jgi:hypothetical protein